MFCENLTVSTRNNLLYDLQENQDQEIQFQDIEKGMTEQLKLIMQTLYDNQEK